MGVVSSYTQEKSYYPLMPMLIILQSILSKNSINVAQECSRQQEEKRSPDTTLIVLSFFFISITIFQNSLKIISVFK